MDIREFFLLFRRERNFFFGIIFGTIALGIIVCVLQPVSFRAEVTMNVARSGVQSTSEYAYDDFYRLQADERFADTVVRWFQSPRIRADIAKESDLKHMSEMTFDADRLSSQVIRVRYVLRDASDAEKVSRAMFAVLNREAESLNTKGKTDGWFTLVGESPSVSDARIGLIRALALSSVAGFFLAFFAVLFRHALADESSKAKQ